MTLREAYNALDGDYDAALAYLRSEQLIERLLLKFRDDTACRRLFVAWESGDVDGAFAAAHEAKGICANLYLTRLGELVSQVTELLRAGGHVDLQRIDTLVEQARGAYARIVHVIDLYASER